MSKWQKNNNQKKPLKPTFDVGAAANLWITFSEHVGFAVYKF